MIETLEEGLSQLSGARVRVRSIRAEPHRKSASFAMYRLAVQLEPGIVLPVVFKDLNPLRQLQNAKLIRRLELGRSRREIWMYRDVLPGLALGPPRLKSLKAIHLSDLYAKLLLDGRRDGRPGACTRTQSVTSTALCTGC